MQQSAARAGAASRPQAGQTRRDTSGLSVLEIQEHIDDYLAAVRADRYRVHANYMLPNGRKDVVVLDKEGNSTARSIGWTPDDVLK